MPFTAEFPILCDGIGSQLDFVIAWIELVWPIFQKRWLELALNRMAAALAEAKRLSLILSPFFQNYMTGSSNPPIFDPFFSHYLHAIHPNARMVQRMSKEWNQEWAKNGRVWAPLLIGCICSGFFEWPHLL